MQKFTFLTVYGSRSFFGNSFKEVENKFFVKDSKIWSFAINNTTGEKYSNWCNVIYK